MMKSILLPSFVWGVFLLTTSCSEIPVKTDEEKALEVMKATMVTGRFDGFPDYKNWIVYISGFNYRSGTSVVGSDGSFQLKAVNIPHGEYRLYFGQRGYKYMGSMKLIVKSERIHLGVIKGGE